MSNKPWRMTEEEYEKELDKLLEENMRTFHQYYDKIKSINLNYTGEDANEIKAYFEKMQESSQSMKTRGRDAITKVPVYFKGSGKNTHEREIHEILERIKIAERMQSSSTLRTLKVQLLANNVDDWTNFSLNPTSLKEVMVRLIAGKQHNVSLCCISYICSSTLINEEFIKDMMYVTSPFFSFSSWEDDVVESICSLTTAWIAGGKQNAFEIIETYRHTAEKYDTAMIDTINLMIKEGEEKLNEKCFRYTEEIENQKKVIKENTAKAEGLEKECMTINSFLMNNPISDKDVPVDTLIPKHLKRFDKMLDEIQKTSAVFDEKAWDQKRKEFRKRANEFSDQQYLNHLVDYVANLPRIIRSSKSSAIYIVNKAKDKIKTNTRLMENAINDGVQLSLTDRIDWSSLDKDRLSKDFLDRFAPCFKQYDVNR